MLKLHAAGGRDGQGPYQAGDEPAKGPLTLSKLSAEAFAIGIHPAEFGDMTLREIFRCFEGAAIKQRRARQADLWLAWHFANLNNAKKLPELAGLMRKLEPAESRVMSPRMQRATILGIASAFGAKITYRKKGETVQ